MTTQQIQCIITLAEEGSFSKAAKKLFVTQPSISQLIKNMETQLGAPLFDRSSSPIQLTPIGQAYYDAAKKILSTERELENRISDINNLKTGSLTIGTTPFRGSVSYTHLDVYKRQHHGNTNAKWNQKSKYRGILIIFDRIKTGKKTS